MQRDQCPDLPSSDSSGEKRQDAGTIPPDLAIKSFHLPVVPLQLELSKGLVHEVMPEDERGLQGRSQAPGALLVMDVGCCCGIV